MKIIDHPCGSHPLFNRAFYNWLYVFGTEVAEIVTYCMTKPPMGLEFFKAKEFPLIRLSTILRAVVVIDPYGVYWLQRLQDAFDFAKRLI